MFNDDEYTTEDRAAGVWGALLLMACIGSCANMPKQVRQNQKTEKVPVKIEHRENISSNYFYKRSYSYILMR